MVLGCEWQGKTSSEATCFLLVPGWVLCNAQFPQLMLCSGVQFPPQGQHWSPLLHLTIRAAP